nr:ATP-binding protein [Magnetospirillum fulvum]
MATILQPDEAEEPILTPPVREAVHQWMTEIRAADEMAKLGIKPRCTALLSGPPGCGKTTLAHHFAMRLGLALVCVNTDQLVSSSLGGTGQNVAAIFAAIEEQEDLCVLFLMSLTRSRASGRSGGANAPTR